MAQLDRNLIALGHGKVLPVSDYYTGGDRLCRRVVAAGQPAAGHRNRAARAGRLRSLGRSRSLACCRALGSRLLPGAHGCTTATSAVPCSHCADSPSPQEYLVRRGQQVTVTLPDGVTTTPGTVTAVSSVATSAPSRAVGRSTGGPAGAAVPGGGQEYPGTPLTIELDPPSDGAGIDQAPVSRVNIVSAQASGVLQPSQ